MAGYDRPAAVARSVIDQDDLIIRTELGFAHGNGPREQGIEASFLVEDRHDDRQFTLNGADLRILHGQAILLEANRLAQLG